MKYRWRNAQKPADKPAMQHATPAAGAGGPARCFALLDDRDASEAHPTSRLYQGFVREHRCIDPATLDATWARIAADQRAGLHAVLLADYEWGAKLLQAGERPGREGACLRVLMFRALRRLSRAQVDAWLMAQGAAGEGQAAGEWGAQAAVDVRHLRPSVEHDAFVAAIAEIHEAIRAGETYQVNYTYRLHGQVWGSPLALYQVLRARQPVNYGAFIALPEGQHDPDGEVTHVLSCSPELFLRHEAGQLTARPMKGTAPRGATPESDSESARRLAQDVKNRAENLMIVDLLRNDLGRVSKIGSVKVPTLFAIEPYATVFQMTSTVKAQVRPEVDMPELLRAVFPCGSITGAPKHHTMERIAGLESTPRGLYCGAIGWLEAPTAGAALGDFCLSVAIRTVTLGRAHEGWRPLSLGVGAGIVLDSEADDEFEECRLKARFLTRLDAGFTLAEALRPKPGDLAAARLDSAGVLLGLEPAPQRSRPAQPA